MTAPEVGPGTWPIPDLVRRFGIDYKRCLPPDAPCQSIFDDFERIRLYTRAQYDLGASQEPTQEHREKPWKAEVRERAEFIVKAANDLTDIEAEESDWRARLEHHIFVRFEYEFEWYVKLSCYFKRSFALIEQQ